MAGPYTQDKIENWVSDFCVSDEIRAFSPAVREVAGDLLVAFLSAACALRDVEPDELEEGDVRAGLLSSECRAAVEGVRNEVPAMCGAMLEYLETSGRLGGGRVLGAFARALRGAYLERASGKVKPIVRAGSKLGRNDPCPCGSGKKYKKCCLDE